MSHPYAPFASKEQEQLVIDLLEAHRTNLEGHREALGKMPDLAAVADDGYAELDAQILLTIETLAMLR